MLNPLLCSMTHPKLRTSFISTTIFANNKQFDDSFPGKDLVDLRFFLSAGSYATMLVKQLVILALDSDFYRGTN